MQSLRNAHLAGKRVVIRVDYNVPLNESLQITDDSRIRASLATISYVLENGASVVLLSHLGRPQGTPDLKYSLRPVALHLSRLLQRPIRFIENCVSYEAQEICRNLQPGEVVLCENIRFYKEETAGDLKFAEQLSKLGDIFVNDAFSVSHRAHASTTTIAQFFEEKFAGFLLEAEIQNANRILKNYQLPFVALIGGAKVSDKIKVVENLLERVTHLFIGGAMAYTFLKAQGYHIGKSRVEEASLSIAQAILEKASQQNVQLILPQDSVIALSLEPAAHTQVVASTVIPEEWIGVDIGPAAISQIQNVLEGAKTILWNGPMGVFEIPEFAKGTLALANLIAAQTQKGAFSLVGGGDSVAALTQSGLTDKISYVSMGGGALLEYLEGTILPGIASLET
ncbi:MAG: phosphoglycerate kinase [Bacteroidia bacterium]|nr:phosphoglycerate kinase [Bacteroidia bacterium]MDW8158461.1 phosphoglycerate kinase [Bacteroidia bacterium]